MADSDSDSGCSTDFEASESISTTSSPSASSARVHEDEVVDYEDDYEVDDFEDESHDVNDSEDNGEVDHDVEDGGYEEESFDEYSASFDVETEGESLRDSISSSDILPESLVAATLTSPSRVWSTGERVQVFWSGENEWFNGVLHDTRRDSKGIRCRVLYDDGEDEWEEASSCRPIPTAGGDLSDLEQLQQLGPFSASSMTAMIGRKALVHWCTEAKWYGGVISAVQPPPKVALQIQYDDGDSRWEQESDFRHILLFRTDTTTDTAPLPSTALRANPTLATALPLPLTAPATQQPPPPPALTTYQQPPPPTGPRVLYARPYQRVLASHFQPVLTARPYRCAVETHIGSIITPRRTWSDHKFSSHIHDVPLSILQSGKSEAGIQATPLSPRQAWQETATRSSSPEPI